MRQTLVRSMLILAGLAVMTTGPVWAQAQGDETRLQAQAQEMDQAMDKEQASGTSRAKVEALAKQFNVPASTVEGMRDQKQGWGGITIQLAMAEHLVKTDPTTYPTISDALKQVQTLRADGKGWGSIAKELGFKLGPVVSDVQRARQEFRATEALADQGRDRVRQEVRAESRLERPDWINRPERPERPMRPERPERLGRNGR